MSNILNSGAVANHWVTGVSSGADSLGSTSFGRALDSYLIIFGFLIYTVKERTSNLTPAVKME